MRSKSYVHHLAVMKYMLVLINVAVAVACDPAPFSPDDDFVPVVNLPDCRPNNDGVIERAELPVVVGATARVRVGVDVAVDIDGVTDNGVTAWDLTLPLPDTEPAGSLTVEPMAGQYFDALFPQADVAAPLVPGGSTLGPLAVDDDGYKLFGAMSADEDPAEGQTRIIYDDPALLYPLPLRLGSRAVTTSRAQNALLLGIPTALTDTTEIEVVRQGRVILPDLIVDNALQVRVRLRRVLLAGDVQQTSYIFVNECIGEVARFVSEAVPLSSPAPDNFTTASEVWRLAL